MVKYKWTIDKMITEERAATVASHLYPDEVQTTNCRQETGREGQLCRVCLEREALWKARIIQVREAMIKAFS